MVMQAICRTASSMSSFVGLYNSTCEGSFSVSYCPGPLKKVSCRTEGNYYCFNYQELILTCIHYSLFTPPKMCCKGLPYVSYLLRSTALLSFSQSSILAFITQFLSAGQRTKSVVFSLLASLRTNSFPSPGHFRYLSLLCSYLPFRKKLR